jgi:rhomboid protease GluP
MKREFPLLTSITIALTAALTATRLLGDGPLDALRRDPTALGHGQVWRLITPTLVQSDPELKTVLSVFALCFVIGMRAERLLPRRRWLALYLAGALAGHAVGEAFQPLNGGTSVAFCGILGGLAVLALLGETPVAPQLRFAAAFALPLSVLDLMLRDIHGAAFLAGFAVALTWTLRERAGYRRERLASAPAASSATPALKPSAAVRRPIPSTSSPTPTIGIESAR